MNITKNITDSYPLWYFINDSIMIIGNLVGILCACIFILAIIRLDHPSYSISNLIVCNTCLAIGLTSTIMLINACYALKSDFEGIGYPDSFCILRGILLNLFYVYMYTSLCLKAFNRLRCIVYPTNRILTSNRCFLIVLLFQWLLIILLVSVIIFTHGVNYDWGSHLCLVPITKTYQSLYIMIIYYISMLFLSSVYISILCYVLRLPLMERCRRRRQIALLRRILVLLTMLLIPGLLSSFVRFRWMFSYSIPTYSLKITTLFDTFGHTGAVITIFISHTKIRRECYGRKKIKITNVVKKFQLENCELVSLKDQPNKK
ncbi:unnamed protein product [Rotaria magnacalcarata]|uniref:G-protein coupled receptors family 1 profile domain-containing protein n=2 Tax=Rotaria magnacalcarata TaxID=392030 RepID=A0A819T1M3_9BILA|nr:unnamed protein product [Rotaria magnacalcarata]CAF2134089.1 unnamed protein product [Rotaria magnacalcarata]CAF2149563.1 unnamed protein product [Rotaria magnacalcarata]CAF3752503.1 unnamed protein product [Rotaria magnacalcarata]CAF3839359.1 unnamed protein product [Rotaria magnacalcarata]